MSKPRKIKQLEDLARTTVGDGKSPNLFFVTLEGVVITVTRSFENARNEWLALAQENRRRDICVEDRLCGTVCQCCEDEDRKGHWHMWDDSKTFGIK